ncbi:MAG: thioredoxin family protein [Tannerellaceae bacterium]|nr:thioredoxin family protein [Tannerellaceae bacterium]
MKRLGLLLLLVSCSWGVSAQQIELSFPALPGKTVHVYYYKGSRPDSLILALDRQGAGKTRLPDGYKGFIRIDVPGSGIVECIGGEPLLRIEGNEAVLDREHVRFPGSRENSFFYRIFDEKSLNMNRRSWIQFGMELYDPQSEIYQLLEKERRKNDEQAAAIAAEIGEARLYASKPMDFIACINDLSEAQETRDTLSLPRLKAYFHTKMDWEALYTSGQFWDIVNGYYAGLFDESRYVEDVSPLFKQMQEPVRSAFLETTYETCERMGWDRAKDRILSYIFENKIEIDAHNANLKRILSAEKTKQGSPAPAIEGLPDESFRGITLLIFYESGCDNCVVQLEEMKQRYAQLRNSGIRIVSVSADTDERVFTYHSKTFPWPDKLCDYKGYGGENFINYAILATPTLFVIGNGMIIGRYATLSDTRLF